MRKDTTLDGYSLLALLLSHRHTFSSLSRNKSTQIPSIISIFFENTSDCVRGSSPATAVLLDGLAYLSLGIAQIMYACFIEGKRVPTFPRYLCQGSKKQTTTHSKTPQPGLQLSAALGNALTLLAKHGLDHGRKKDFPAEVAMESLSSSTPLEVAAAEDMGLKR